jgi:hypothetical protein
MQFHLVFTKHLLDLIIGCISHTSHEHLAPCSIHGTETVAVKELAVDLRGKQPDFVDSEIAAQRVQTESPVSSIG